MNRQKRIFLSHKSKDKPMVTRFYTALKTIGFEPWLDDPDMAAGAVFERKILEGFKASCAAVFFLTEQFKDAKYLAAEIEYAIAERRSKGDRFAIISIDLSKKKERLPIPPLLETYLVKKTSHELTALYEIIRALPIAVGPATWRGQLGPDK